jgi:hypothetical protein
MRHVESSLLALLATLALTGIITATASGEALPNILPNASAAEVLKHKGGGSSESKFGNGIVELSSPRSEGEGEGNTPKSGLFVNHLDEVESALSGTKCTGLHDTAEGTITVLGTYHIRDYKAGSSLRTAAILILLPIHFTCGTTLPVLIVGSGCVAGKVTPESALTKTLTVTFDAGSNGKDNEIITVLNEANTAEEACQLLSKEGAGSTKLSFYTSVLNLGGFEQNSKAVEVLVMPL